MKTASAPHHIDDLLGKRALKRIQSVEDKWMYYEVTEAALVMATAGYLDEANELLECLWKYKWPHGRDTWLPDQSFEVLWYASGKRPAGVPFSQTPIDSIDLAHRKYCAHEHILPSYQMQRGPDFTWQMLPPVFRYSYLACAVGDALPPTSRELEALAGFEKYFGTYAETGSEASYGYGDATCLAAELAAKNGQTEQAVRFARLWAHKYSEMRGSGINFPCMASNRHVAPLLLQGILSEPLGLTKASCQLYLKNLKAAVDARMKRGRKLAYGKWTWEKLLTSASKRAIKAEPDLFTKDERKSKWLGRPPASNDAISATEKRLNLKLPTDYVEFLSTSNGFSAFSVTALALLAVEKINWLKDSIDAEMLNILKDYPGEDLPSAIESSILISELKETDMVLLIPPHSGNDQWQCWFFAHWVPGETRFPGFRHYLEQAFQDLQSEAIM